MTALTEELFEHLRARILAGDLSAGSRLPPERELAAQHRTNRNTMREAIRRLEQARLVTVRQGQGVTVADFRQTGTIELLAPFLVHASDPAEKARVLDDLLEPRAKVIDFLVEAAARAALPEDLGRLAAAEPKLRRAEDRRDPVAHVAAQQEYFDALVEATHSLPLRWIANPLLSATREMLLAHPGLVLFTPSFAEMAESVDEALRARDVAAARGAFARFHETADALVRPLLRRPPAAEGGPTGP